MIQILEADVSPLIDLRTSVQYSVLRTGNLKNGEKDDTASSHLRIMLMKIMDDTDRL